MTTWLRKRGFSGHKAASARHSAGPIRPGATVKPREAKVSLSIIWISLPRRAHFFYPQPA